MFLFYRGRRVLGFVLEMGNFVDIFFWDGAVVCVFRLEGSIEESGLGLVRMGI